MRSRFLCILEPDQREEYAEELQLLVRSGVELDHSEDAEAALEQIAAETPDMVIVGMEVGIVEGLEFLATALSRFQDRDLPVVVLPRKDDPFPPVCHSRDRATGRSTADEVTFDELAAMAGAIGAREAAAQEQPLADRPLRDPEAEQPAPPVHGRHEPQPGPALAGAPPSVLAEAPTPGDTPPAPNLGSRPRWLLPAIGFGLAAAVGLVALLVTRDGGPPAELAETGATSREADARDRPASRTPTPPPVPAPARGPRPRTADAAAPSSDAVAHGLDEPVVLPLRFTKSSAAPIITDEEALARLVRLLKSAAQLRVLVAGHTSTEGSRAYNLELGQRRARAAKRELARRGIAPGRIRVTSRGGQSPLVSNATADGRATNRRVTLQAVQ